MEISAEEYWAIDRALRRKARGYSLNLKSHGFDDLYFYSTSSCTCAYEDPPKSFRTSEKEGVRLSHFLPFPCNCKKRSIMASKEEAICLAWTMDKDGNDRYYLTTHRIGRCPWKEKS